MRPAFRHPRGTKIESRIVPGVLPDQASPSHITREFLERARTGRFLPAGEAKEQPEVLLRGRYLPRYKVSLFGRDFYLTDYRFDDDLNFLVAYVAEGRRIHPRIFYKDSSLVWRVATHVVRTGGENWIGKGAVRRECRDGHEVLTSAEETTDLPFELQGALDEVSRRGATARRDARAVPLVLRGGHRDRMQPYADFSEPRRRAMEHYRIHGGRPIARFERALDPTSLRFARGFEPDFERGPVEHTQSASRLYGGTVHKLRFASRNGRVQYQFVLGPHHAWLNPPQATTTELSTYGVRTVDALAPEELFVPGYEYHFLDATVDPPELVSQIPEGFVGEPSTVDEHRSDASPWIERMPVIRDFRRAARRVVR